MPTETTRQSLNTNLETRYNNSKVGSTFNAKNAGTSTIVPSIKSTLYDSISKFIVNDSINKGSNFKGTNSGTYTEISKFANNINTVPYDK